MAALLSTIGGRLRINLGVWMCVNGHIVDYDGAENGFFATPPETVYVREFLDAALGIFVIARSTMAAPARYLSRLLNNNRADKEAEHSQARQLLSDTCGQVSETLFIPDSAFECGDPGANDAEGGRFDCMLMDRPMLTDPPEHILPMLRPGMDAPKVNMPVTYSCVVRNVTARALVRLRVRSAAEDSVAYTTVEARKNRAFILDPFSQSPAPPPTPTETSRGLRTPVDADVALYCTLFRLFTAFFYAPNIDSVIILSAARRTGAANSPHGIDNESLVDVVGAGNSDDGIGSQYSSDEVHMMAEENGNTVKGSAGSVLGDAGTNTTDQTTADPTTVTLTDPGVPPVD